MFSIFYHDHEGMSFMTFVLNSLYPKGNNDLKDEGLWYLTFYVALFLIHSIWEQVPNSKPNFPFQRGCAAHDPKTYRDSAPWNPPNAATRTPASNPLQGPVVGGIPLPKVLKTWLTIYFLHNVEYYKSVIIKQRFMIGVFFSTEGL
jgi:hypothetical protein